MYDKLAESTQTAGRFLQFLGYLLCIASIAIPFVIYTHLGAQSSLTTGESELLIGGAVGGIVIALVAVAGGYALLALSAILDHLSEYPITVGPVWTPPSDSSRSRSQ
jgi:small-conductance mechanosensitive channel